MSSMWKDLIRLTRDSKYHNRKMQHRLVLYWCSMALILFGTLILILSLTGILSLSERDLGQALEIRQSTVCEALYSHLDVLEAQCIALASDSKLAVEEQLYNQPVSTLNDRPEDLCRLQQSLYGPVNTALQVAPCSGAFVLLDATTNTQAPKAEICRSGLYLRYTNLSTPQSARQDRSLFRGIPQVARAADLPMHTQWELEFDITLFADYEAMLRQQPGRLGGSCIWSPRIQLPNTWESILYLTVPFFDGHGTVAGFCGMELSDTYFRLAYPSMESEYGTMMTLLAPLDGDRLLVNQGLVGDTAGSMVDSLENLEVESHRHFQSYRCQDITYLGTHTVLDSITINGLPLAVVTLLPQESFSSVVHRERNTWALGALLFLVAMVLLSVYFSRGFVKPILTALESIRTNSWDRKKPSSYLEINDLFDFLAERDQEYDEALRNLEQEKQAAQTRADSVESEYHKAKTNYETAQAQLARLAGDSPDTAGYRLFLRGLHTLTPTERGIFNLYLEGHSAKEILELLSIKENTLKYHNRNIYSKLGVRSRKQLLQYAAMLQEEDAKPQS